MSSSNQVIGPNRAGSNEGGNMISLSVNNASCKDSLLETSGGSRLNEKAGSGPSSMGCVEGGEVGAGAGGEVGFVDESPAVHVWTDNDLLWTISLHL